MLVSVAVLGVGLVASPAPAIPSLSVGMYDDYYSPTAVTGVVGLNDAEWHNDGASFHNVRIDLAPRWFTLNLDEGQSGSVPLRYAGTFDYTCTYHEETMTGTLAVKPRVTQASGRAGTTLDVILGSVAPASDGYAFDVQRSRNGAAWGPAKRVAGTTYGFSAKRPGRYDVQARLVDPGSGEVGAWSPSVRLRVR